MNKRIMGLAIAAVTIGLVSVAINTLVQPDKATAPTTARDGLRYNWVANAKQSYRLAVNSNVSLRFAEFDFSRRVQQQVEGTLHMRVMEVNRDRVSLGFEFEPDLYRLDGEPARIVESDLSQPFLVRFEPSGRPTRFEFQPGVVRPARILLEESLRLFQAVLPDSGDSAWQIEEQHATGRYRADYRRQSGAGEIRKQKAAYTQVNVGMTAGQSAEPARVDLIKSESEITIAREASWLSSANVREELVVWQGATRISEASVEASLNRLTDPVATVRLFEAAEWDELLAAARDPHPRDADTAGPATSSDAADQYITHLNASNENRATTVRQLGAMIAADPTLAERVVARMGEPGLSGRTDALLINALQIGGSESAQRALVQIMSNPSDRSNNRSRAAVAVGSLEHPSDETIAALYQTALQRGDGPSATLSNTAMLAMGTMSRTLRDSDPNRSQGITDLLTQRLQHSATASETVVTLKALANTRNAMLIPTVSPYLTHGSPQVRAAAIEALGRFGDGKSAATLTDFLRKESDPAVLAAAVKSLDELPYASRDALAIVNERVVGERSAEVRYHMTRYLAHNLDQFPEANATLARLAVKDGSYRVRKLAWATIAHHKRRDDATR